MLFTPYCLQSFCSISKSAIQTYVLYLLHLIRPLPNFSSICSSSLEPLLSVFMPTICCLYCPAFVCLFSHCNTHLCNPSSSRHFPNLSLQRCVHHRIHLFPIFRLDQLQIAVVPPPIHRPAIPQVNAQINNFSYICFDPLWG